MKRLAQIAKSALPEPTAKIRGDAERFWSGREGSSEIKDLSHWRGEGRWTADAEWTGIGERHLRMFDTLCLMANSTRQPLRMVEYGPGGGPNLMQFAKRFVEIYGIDISANNLRECEAQLTQAGFSGFHPVLNEIDNPEHCLTVIDTPVDFFLSTAVYQHFPGKEYGVRVTQIAHALLAEDGLALIQTRYDDGTERFRSKRGDYRNNVLSFTTYSVPEFWEIASNSGFEPLGVTLDTSVRYAYYFLKKRASDIGL